MNLISRVDKKSVPCCDVRNLDVTWIGNQFLQSTNKQNMYFVGCTCVNLLQINTTKNVVKIKTFTKKQLAMFWLSIKHRNWFFLCPKKWKNYYLELSTKIVLQIVKLLRSPFTKCKNKFPTIRVAWLFFAPFFQTGLTKHIWLESTLASI